MFTIIRKMLILGSMVAGVMTLLALIFPADANNYLAAAGDKRHLLYSIDSPRIILMGGSNVAFSMDSEKISEQFEMPVINMGLHVDMGLRFMLNEVGPALRDGDVVVIFPEYENFYSISLDGRSTELGAVIRFCPECISSISTPMQALNAAAGISQMLEGDFLRSFKSSKPHEKIYFRQGFNQHGDMVAHLKQVDKLKPNNHVSEIEVLPSNPAIELLNSFYQSHRADHIQIFVVFPAIPVDEYKNQEEKFTALYDLISAQLEIPFLGLPRDFLYPEDFFYDTVYHMNRTGRERHTLDVIEVLTPVMQR